MLMKVFNLIKTALTKTDCYLVREIFFLAQNELMLFMSDMFEICLTAYRPTLLNSLNTSNHFLALFGR